MQRIRFLAASPLTLLVCLLAGGLTGSLLPALATPFFALGQVYLAVVNAAALPLLVVATFFGLRQTLALPTPLRRAWMILLLTLATVAVGAVSGTLAGTLSGAGQGVSLQDRSTLGAMVQDAENAGGHDEMLRYAPDGAAQGLVPQGGMVWLPDNFFRVLAQGHTLGILTCAILFGLAFAMVGKGQNNRLMGIFEGIYRTLEMVIGKANVLIPLLVFGMAAHFSAHTEMRTLSAMGEFLLTFLGCTALLCVLATVLICRSSQLAWPDALESLKAPALICLASSNSSAAIPDTIRALSARMGFSRGIVELMVPLASVYARTGSALYFGLLGVFVANLYGRELAWVDLGLVCLGAMLAELLSAGRSGAAVVGAGSVVLSLLNLPTEAALALFLAVDLICEGPRNLLSLLANCVLIILVCRGLPSEQAEARQAADAARGGPIALRFDRKGLLLGLGVFSLLAALLVAAGVAVGVRMQHKATQGATAPSPRGNLGDNPPNIQ